MPDVAEDIKIEFLDVFKIALELGNFKCTTVSNSKRALELYKSTFNSDRDKQAFLRKMIIIRVEESGKKLNDPKVSSAEKVKIRENLKEYHRTLSDWAGKTSKYEV